MKDWKGGGGGSLPEEGVQPPRDMADVLEAGLTPEMGRGVETAVLDPTAGRG